MTIEPRELAEFAKEAALGKKAYNITVLDIRKISVISDFFVICSGYSSVNVQAIAEEVVNKIKERYGLIPRKEGIREGRWVLLDYGDIIVHVFQEEERLFYNLEHLWGDAPVVNMPERLDVGNLPMAVNEAQNTEVRSQ